MPTTKASGTRRAARKSPAHSITPRARSKSSTGARRAPAAGRNAGPKETAAASAPTWAEPQALSSTEPFNFTLPWLQPATTTMPLAADQLVAMQQEYVQRLTGLWQDFFAHPERTTAPIADPRYSDPSWQKNSLASVYARTDLLHAEFFRDRDGVMPRGQGRSRAGGRDSHDGGHEWVERQPCPTRR